MAGDETGKGVWNDVGKAMIWEASRGAKTRGFHTQLDEGPETP